MALVIGGKKIGPLAIGGKAVSRLVYARRVIYSAVRGCYAAIRWRYEKPWTYKDKWKY